MSGSIGFSPRGLAFLVLGLAALSGSLASAQTASVDVPGTCNPWLAGMPDGSTSQGDSAPGQSPALVPIAITPGAQISIVTVSGVTGYDGSVACEAEGCPYANLCHSSDNGIAGVCLGSASCLIGVFLGSAQPDLSDAPDQLDFAPDEARDFSTLSPGLKQVFFLGDGRRTSNGAVQVFIAPPGATRLFLGSADGTGWFNNVGVCSVTLNQTGGHSPFCSADFNADGDVGTDADIEAFFACLAGNCCAACGSADFNGDGDVGTDQDIEAFFRVLAGGAC